MPQWRLAAIKQINNKKNKAKSNDNKDPRIHAFGFAECLGFKLSDLVQELWIWMLDTDPYDEREEDWPEDRWPYYQDTQYFSTRAIFIVKVNGSWRIQYGGDIRINPSVSFTDNDFDTIGYPGGSIWDDSIIPSAGSWIATPFNEFREKFKEVLRRAQNENTEIRRIGNL